MYLDTYLFLYYNLFINNNSISRLTKKTIINKKYKITKPPKTTYLNTIDLSNLPLPTGFSIILSVSLLCKTPIIHSLICSVLVN